MEKDRCKGRLKSAITQRDKAAVTNMPLQLVSSKLIFTDGRDGRRKDGRLKRHTESEVFAIQDQAVTTKYIKKHIYGTREYDKCRLCNEYKETIHHITSACPIYARSLYLMRHYNVARYIHHRIASSFSLLEDTSVAWYNHEHLPIIENDVIKVLWDFDIQTDKHVTSL